MGRPVNLPSAHVWRTPLTAPRAAALGGFVVFGLVAWFVGIPCIFHALTGLYCPGCGATRAVKALAHGNVVAALHNNAWLLLIAGPALGLHVATWFSGHSKLARTTHLFLHVAAWTALGFLVLRNIPIAPLNLLAPIP